MKFFKEFEEFAMRGNVLDMAVGIIIGGCLSHTTACANERRRIADGNQGFVEKTSLT
jgi:hypothetical protein